jgi:hypothetical protein
MSPLGPNQYLALDALRRHRCWPSRWTMGTRSATVRVLDSLVVRGLVIERDGDYQLSTAGANLVGTQSFARQMAGSLR